MERMRELLRSSLSRSLETLSPEDRLAAAWPVACGSALASRAHVLALSPEGVVRIAVTSPEWVAQFIDMRSVLCRDLARIAGVRLSGIHFESTGPNRSTFSRPTGASR